MMAKQPKKPTRVQKQIIYKNGFNWAEWMVISDDGIVI